MRVTIGVLSRRTGCPIETIRYYERLGLMPRPPRTEGGHRVYSAEHVKRLVFVRRTRDLGFTLAQVRTLLGLVDAGRYTCAGVQRITLAHIADVHAKLEGLRRLERTLKRVVAGCPGGTRLDCPIIDELFLLPAEPLPRPRPHPIARTGDVPTRAE